eukprot:EG_transcript_35945
MKFILLGFIISFYFIVASGISSYAQAEHGYQLRNPYYFGPPIVPSNYYRNVVPMFDGLTRLEALLNEPVDGESIPFFDCGEQCRRCIRNCDAFGGGPECWTRCRFGYYWNLNGNYYR